MDGIAVLPTMNSVWERCQYRGLMGECIGGIIVSQTCGANYELKNGLCFPKKSTEESSLSSSFSIAR